jgi:hypothetical protein
VKADAVIEAQAVVADCQEILGNVSTLTVSPFCLISHSYIVLARGAIIRFLSKSLIVSFISKFSFMIVLLPVTIVIVYKIIN